MSAVKDINVKDRYHIIELLKKANIKLIEHKDGVRCNMSLIPDEVKMSIIKYINGLEIPDEFKIN